MIDTEASARRSTPEEVEALITVDPNGRNEFGETPLHDVAEAAQR